MIRNNRRMITCCFTGHRPGKLHHAQDQIISQLAHEIDQAIEDGYRVFISGMVQGIDIWAAQIVLMRKTQYQDIELICALPYPTFDSGMSAAWRCAYRSIIDQADHIEVISPRSSMNCYQLRNIWMVDRSSLVIAAYNETARGTKNTIAYAETNKIPVRGICGA